MVEVEVEEEVEVEMEVEVVDLAEAGAVRALPEAEADLAGARGTAIRLDARAALRASPALEVEAEVGEVAEVGAGIRAHGALLRAGSLLRAGALLRALGERHCRSGRWSKTVARSRANVRQCHRHG